MAVPVGKDTVSLSTWVAISSTGVATVIVDIRSLPLRG
jgi:hypothetical protein